MRSKVRATVLVRPSTLRCRPTVSRLSRHHRSAQRACVSRSGHWWHGCDFSSWRSRSTRSDSAAVTSRARRRGESSNPWGTAIRSEVARSRRDLGDLGLKCGGTLTCVSASTGSGTSTRVSRRNCLSSVTTAGPVGVPLPPRAGCTTTAHPARRPAGMRMTSPIRSASSDTAASARRDAERALTPSFSASASERRSAAYSRKSPRWQCIASA